MGGWGDGATARGERRGSEPKGPCSCAEPPRFGAKTRWFSRLRRARLCKYTQSCRIVECDASKKAAALVNGGARPALRRREWHRGSRALTRRPPSSPAPLTTSPRDQPVRVVHRSTGGDRCAWSRCSRDPRGRPADSNRCERPRSFWQIGGGRRGGAPGRDRDAAFAPKHGAWHRCPAG